MGEDNENYEFNVLAALSSPARTGYYIGNDWIDFGLIGLGDLSIEMWFRYFPDGQPTYRDAGLPVGTNGIVTGWSSAPFGGVGSNTFGLGFDGMNATSVFGYGRNPPSPFYQIVGAAPQDGEWHHWCGTYDRSGFMNFYIDGRAVAAAVDISAEVAFNIATGDARYVGASTKIPTIILPSRGLGLTGAAAFHTSILTGAQIRASVFGRTTQFLPTTVGAWNFNVYTILSPENLGFMDAETFLDHRPNGWAHAVHRPKGLALPLPSIVVHDLSRQGREMGLFTPTFNHYVSLDPSWK